MALRAIRGEDDPVLRKKSREVTEFDAKLWILLDDMKDTVKKAEGAGLAGPQVGVLKRVVIVDDGSGPVELVNPVILKAEGTQEDREGCLSIPGVWGIVPRPKKVKIEAQDRYGEKFTLKGEDLLARAICHEMDHLDGILFTDKVTRYVNPDEE